jgi:methylglutaconyl-CoA hydratase
MRKDGGVLHLTLNRPDRRNAIDEPMVERLLECVAEADLAHDVRVVTLRGAGTDFCAGADLHELLASVEKPPEDNTASAARLGDVFIRMRDLPKPIVAVVHGRALAGGCGLAMACDLVIARSDATFGYPEVSRGFVPAMVMAMLRRAVGEKTAFDLVATGRTVTAEVAVHMGLISRVVAAEQFESEVAQLLGGLAASSPSALALTKRQLYAIDMMDFPEAIKLGARVNAVARSTPDFRKAVERFFKR